MIKSPEFILAVRCCQLGFRGNDSSHVAIPSDIDWDRFLRLVRFHRIEGLAHNGLKSNGAAVPDAVRQSLSASATENVAQNLRMMAEARALQGSFEAAGIPLLFLKGVTLGALAYANPGLKSSVDIDLLIDPADLGRAADLLRDHRYRLLIPRNHKKLATWHRRSKESLWEKPPSFQVDLHTRMADNPRLIPGIDVYSPAQLVDVGNGVTLPTLGPDELFAYLAVHGTASVWFRLKWISDLAGLLHSKSADEIDCLYRRSQELEAGRAAAQALLLADALFGTLASMPALREELLRDKINRLLLKTSLTLVARDPVEPTEHFLGTLPMHWTPFLFRPGWAYKSAELSGQAGRLLNRFLS